MAQGRSSHLLATGPPPSLLYLEKNISLTSSSLRNQVAHLSEIYSPPRGMKIFNWIHRNRFPCNPHPVEASIPVGSSGRRSGSSIQDAKAEKEPLLEEEVKATSDWELDGILTIGTLAIDPLQQNTMNEGQEEEEGGYHEEVMAGTKLLNEIFSHKHSGCEIEEVEETEMVMYKKLSDLEMGMRRVTLLDLFMADELPHQKQRLDDCSVVVRVQEEDGMVIDVKTKKKKKLVLYNKIVAVVGAKKGSKLKKTDDVPAFKKLQRFMTRMMKKKIHPDMEAKKGQVVKQNDDAPVQSNDQYHAQLTESVHLLPTQGIMA